MIKDDLKNWQNFCKSPAAHASSDFYALFLEPVSESELDDVFEFVEHGDILKPRLARLLGLQGASTPIAGPTRKSQIEAIMNDVIAQKQKVMAAIGSNSLVEMLEVLKLTWGDEAFFRKERQSAGSWVKAEVMIFLGDYFRSALGDYSPIISGLMEAPYGLTQDYEMVWYLLTPLADVDYDPESSIVIRENLVEYLFTETDAVILDRSV